MTGYNLVLLNAFPVNAFPYDIFTVAFMREEVSNLAKDVVLAESVKCFIRHPATVELLNTLLKVKLEPSSELYRYSTNDIIYIITLKSPERGKETAKLSLDDLLIYRVIVAEGSWL